MLQNHVAGFGEYTLAQRAQEGDRLAFDKLVLAHDQFILRLALHLCGSEDDAQVLHEQVFLAAFQDLGSFRFQSSFRVWLCQILCAILKDHSKNEPSKQGSSTPAPTKDENIETAPGPPDESSPAGPESIQRIEAERIQWALRTLDRKEWLVFQLRHYARLRLRTIAEILQISEGSATSALLRATDNLRRALATSGER